VIAWRADLIKPTMRSRQGICLRQRTLLSHLPGSIDIDHYPLLTCSVKQATGRRKRFAGKYILLKEGSEGFHRWLIESRKETGQG
jgi:hypothetical protein